MEWLLVIAALIVTAIIAFRFGVKAAAASVSPAITNTLRAQAHDRMNFLNTLRRELANYLIWRDPDRYLHLYQLILTETASFADLRPDARAARLAELSKKYPQYEDFDLPGTQVYVLYPDGLSMHTIDDIEERYRDIASFQALTIASDEHWRMFHVADAQELQHLTEYVQRIKDTRLRARLGQAIRERYVWESGKTAGEADDFESRDFIVRRVPHFAEFRLGIHIKATNECGLYGLFHDDARDKTYQSYYRTDLAFNTEQHLHVIHELLENADD